MDQLDKKSNKAHDGKSDGGGNSNLLELWKTRKKIIRITLKYRYEQIAQNLKINDTSQSNILIFSNVHTGLNSK